MSLFNLKGAATASRKFSFSSITYRAKKREGLRRFNTAWLYFKLRTKNRGGATTDLSKLASPTNSFGILNVMPPISQWAKRVELSSSFGWAKALLC